MITLHFHLLPQYKYELFHIYFTNVFVIVTLDRGRLNAVRSVHNDRDQYFMANNISISPKGVAPWFKA